MEKKQRKLFRLTKNRTIMLERIITNVNFMVESKSENSYGRQLLSLPSNKASEEEKKARLAQMDQDLELYTLYHDVLETVISHTNECNRNRFMLKNRGWVTEWDVPLEIFNDSIEGVKELLMQSKSISADKHKPQYDKKILFLETLKDFRNAN